MEVPISRMKDIGDCKIILPSNLHHFSQHLRKLCSGNGSITDQIVRSQTSNGAKGPFPSCPELHPLCFSLCSLHFTGIIFSTDFHDSFCQSLHSIFQSVQLDQQDSLCIQGEASMDRFLHGLDRQPIQHLQSSRNDPIGNDGGNGPSSIFQRIIDGQHGL